MLDRNKNRRIFAVRNHEKGCKFFESNEPIKSSLKGKEPKIPMRLETGESARQTEKTLSITIYNEEFDPGSG